MFQRLTRYKMRIPASTPITIPAMAPPLSPEAAFALETAASNVGAVVGLAWPNIVGE